MSEPVHAYLVANARFHDTDFARLELLKLLAEHDGVRTRVADSFADVDAIRRSDFLLTYTCDLRPTPEQEEALREFVREGGDGSRSTGPTPSWTSERTACRRHAATRRSWRPSAAASFRIHRSSPTS